MKYWENQKLTESDKKNRLRMIMLSFPKKVDKLGGKER